MPFRARLNGRPVVPSMVDDGTSVTCPACGDTMYPRSAPSRARHFVHSSRSRAHGCPSTEPESETHAEAVANVEVALHEQFGDGEATIKTEAEVDLSDIVCANDVRRADVLVEFEERNRFFGKGIAVEVQYKNESKDQEQVTHDYLAAGYSVLWLPAGLPLLDSFDYDVIGEEFRSDDGNGYPQRTNSPSRITNCEPLGYNGKHAWRRVPSYAHPRGQNDLITYDICIGQRCELRRIHEPDGGFTYTESGEHAPDFPLKALRNAIVRESTREPLWKWAGKKYHTAPLEKLLAAREEIDLCRGPKGIHEWGAPKTLWTNRWDDPKIELRGCRYCPVRLVTNHRGRPEHSTFCLYGRDPPFDWDEVYFQASPPECDHYLYDEAQIENYCPKCGATMEDTNMTLLDY